MTDRVDINRLLGDMRSMKMQTQAFQRPQGLAVGDMVPNRALSGLQVEPANKMPSFGDLMTKALNNVNDVQQKSSSMADAYEKGVAGCGHCRCDDCLAKSLSIFSGNGAGT